MVLCDSDFHQYGNLFDSRVCMTNNYLNSISKNQTLLSDYQKEVHSLLYVLDDDEYLKRVIILSVEDADRFITILNSESYPLKGHYDVVDLLGRSRLLNPQKLDFKSLALAKSLHLDVLCFAGYLNLMTSDCFSDQIESWCECQPALKIEYIKNVVVKAMRKQRIESAQYVAVLENLERVVSSVKILHDQQSGTNLNSLSVKDALNYIKVEFSDRNIDKEDVPALVPMLVSLSDQKSIEDQKYFNNLCDFIIPGIVNISNDAEHSKQLIKIIPFVQGPSVDHIIHLASHHNLYDDLDKFSIDACQRRTENRIMILRKILMLYDSMPERLVQIASWFFNEDNLKTIQDPMAIVIAILSTNCNQMIKCRLFSEFLRYLQDANEYPGFVFICGLMIGTGEEAIVTFAKEQIEIIKRLIIEQKLGFKCILSSSMIEAARLERIFNEVYLGGGTLSEENIEYALANIRNYAKDSKSTDRLLTQVAQHHPEIIIPSFLNYFQNGIMKDSEFIDYSIEHAINCDHKELLDIIKSGEFKENITKSLAHGDSFKLSTLLNILSIHQEMFYEIVLSEVAKLYVDGSQMSDALDQLFLDRSLLSRKMLSYYVSQCLKYGSMEFLKLKVTWVHCMKSNTLKVDQYLH